MRSLGIAGLARVLEDEGRPEEALVALVTRPPKPPGARTSSCSPRCCVAAASCSLGWDASTRPKSCCDAACGWRAGRGQRARAAGRAEPGLDCSPPRGAARRRGARSRRCWPAADDVSLPARRRGRAWAYPPMPAEASSQAARYRADSRKPSRNDTSGSSVCATTAHPTFCGGQPRTRGLVLPSHSTDTETHPHEKTYRPQPPPGALARRSPRRAGRGRQGERRPADLQRQTRPERDLRHRHPDAGAASGRVRRQPLNDSGEGQGDHGALNAAMAKADAPSEADREAPPAGGDGSAALPATSAATTRSGSIRATTRSPVDGKFRTSIIYEPQNGRSRR